MSACGSALAVTYPAGASSSGVINVTALPTSLTSTGFTNLDRTGATDNRARLQALVNRYKQETAGNPNQEARILYFPDGTYRLSGGITGVTNTPGQGGILFQGQSRDGTVLKLDNSATGFGDANTPKKLISFFEGVWTNNAFFNGMEDLTIDTGTGNPGAIGVAFVSNNCGYVRNLLIRTGSNGTAPGVAGLLLNTTLTSLNPSGVGITKGVEVRGFQYGIHCGEAMQYGFTMEDITLSSQTVAGIRVSNQPVSIRRVTSTNSVPAVLLTGNSGQLVLMDSTFNGGSATRAAVERSGGYLFARNVTKSGYRAIIQDGVTDVTTNLADDEYLSAGSEVLKLWASTPSRTLDLPVVETPTVPWDTSAANWAFVDPTVQDDDTAALQAALSSGASTICVLPDSSSSVKISSTLTIGPNVRRIIGQWNGINPAGFLYHADPGLPIFKFSSSNHPAVLIEKFRSDYLAGRKSYLIRNESAADLILRDIFYVAGPLYRNTSAATGRLFIENVHCLPGGQNVDFENAPVGIEITGQTAYLRQVNPEQFSTGLVNDGGTVWIFGFKVGEAIGPVIRSTNNATTEILGGVMNMSHPSGPAVPSSTKILDVDRSNVSAILLERYESTLGWGQGNQNAVIERRGNETRTLANTSGAGVPRRPGQLGGVLPLFVGYQFGATIGASTASFREGDGRVNAFVVSRGNADTSAAVTIAYSVSGSAVVGTDYVGLPGSVTIPAGQSEAVIPVTLLDNNVANLPRELTITLQAGAGYELGQVNAQTIQIIDNDLVTISSSTAVLAANSTAVRTVTLRNPTNAPQTVTVVMPSSANYEYQTSDQAGGPTFAWTDISATGTKTLENTDDGTTGALPMGFPFPYYGSTYSNIHINSNGFTLFAPFPSGQGLDYINRDLRNVSDNANGFPNMIAPMWEDLNPAAPGSDAVYYKQQDADTFIVQWNSLRPFGNNQDSNRVTFQLILKRSGTILFQYLQMNSEPNSYSYTTGLKNLTESKNLLISSRSTDGVFNPDFAHPLMAVRLNPLASWISATTTSVVIPANGTATLDLNFDSANFANTSVTTGITFSYPDPNIGIIDLPVSMVVTSGQPPVASNVTISGTAAVGQTLTANYTYSDPESDPQGATLIEWLDAASAAGPFDVVATGATYPLTASSAGRTIRLRVTPVSTNLPTQGTPVLSSILGPVPAAPPLGPTFPGNLAGYWTFDDAKNPATDSSGNARHATIQSGSTLVPAGRHGDALSIAGNGGAQAGTAHFVTGDFTIAAWVYHSGNYTTSTNEIILSKGWDFYLALDTSAADGKLRIQFKHSGGMVTNAHLSNAKTLISPDAWHHVAVVRSGAAFTFTIDGVAHSPSFTSGLTTAAPSSNAVALTVGYNAVGSGTWWRGRLDEVQLYTRALSEGEIATVYGWQPDVLAAWQSGAFAALPGGSSHPDAALTANPDGDTFNNLLEFAFRSSPLTADGAAIAPIAEVVNESGSDYLGIRFVRRRGTGTGSAETGYTIDGITYTVETSNALQTGSWQTGNAVLQQVGSPVANADGTETVTVRLKSPMSGSTPQFVRLKVSSGQ